MSSEEPCCYDQACPCWSFFGQSDKKLPTVQADSSSEIPEWHKEELAGTYIEYDPKVAIPIVQSAPSYDPSEQDILLEVFTYLLRQVTKDGGKKRAAGEKKPWFQDDSHRAAIFSHLNKREHGEIVDPDSGTHPYVHLGWRALAQAYREMYGSLDPKMFLKMIRREEQ